MNKTYTINISGIIFHIDEFAFEKLKGYLKRPILKTTKEMGVPISLTQ